MEHNYLEALIGLQDIDELARRYRILTYRENLNFNILLAWETYGQTADQGFAVWFEENVVRQ